MMTKSLNLSILRVLACIGVFITHIGQLIPVSGITGNIVSFGKYGVYIFFLISGILGIESYSKYQNARAYYVNRAKRILPIYFTVIIWYMLFYNIILAGYVIPEDIYKLGWIRYFLFINFCVPGDDFWMNLGAVWTISCFVLFYLLVPVYYKYIQDMNRAYINLMICLLLKCIIPNPWFQTVCLLYWFALGIAIHFALEEKRQHGLILYSCFMILAMLIMRRYDDALLYGHIFAIIIIVLDHITDFAHLPNLIKKVISILDEYSYCIYLIHPVVIALIKNILCKWYDMSTRFEITIGYIVGTAGLSILCHLMIEKPIDKIGRRKGKMMEGK